jgi:hypothetical protein
MSNLDKIIIDLGSVKIDLFIEPEYCPTCENSELAGIRSQEDNSVLVNSQPRVRSSFGLGAFNYNRADLEKYKSRHERVKINAMGMFSLANDVPPTLAMEVVESVKVFGVFQAQSDVKNVLIQAGKIS